MNGKITDHDGNYLASEVIVTDEHGNPIPGPLELADMLVRIKKIEQWIEQQMD